MLVTYATVLARRELRTRCRFDRGFSRSCLRSGRTKGWSMIDHELLRDQLTMIAAAPQLTTRMPLGAACMRLTARVAQFIS